MLYGKGYFDNIDFPQDAAICDEDFDVYLKDLDKRPARVLGPAIDHREALIRTRAMTTKPRHSPEPRPPPIFNQALGAP